MDTELGVLFGALAVEAGHLTPTRFIGACEVLVRDPNTSLPQYLLDRQWITEETKPTLDRLVADALARHDGSVQDALRAIPGAHIRYALRIFPESQLEMTVDFRGPWQKHVPVETVDFAPQSRSRYVLSRVQGKGGLGQVWLAVDQDLQREVALKEVLPGRKGESRTTNRLYNEAQITGQLEHPNIVPVYELVRGPNEGVFYTMRFLRGRDLQKRISDYHKQGHDWNNDRLALRELLSIFVSICNALAYAHSRGVVHRDLKPQNIMLGSFGEVMVVDWGLAKLLDRKDELSDDRRIRVADSKNGEETREGSIIGSPVYMAPEQADGKNSLVDDRTDIYGLGAILFSILSGRAPHRSNPTDAPTEDSADDTISMMRRISEGPTPCPRELDKSIPPALDAICAKAMAKQRSERYASALDLAQDVTRWLADEPVSAFKPPWPERLARWLRRHRTWVRAATASLVLVAIVSTVAAVLVARARDRVTEALADSESAHKKTEAALAREQLALGAERDARAEALQRFKDARATIDKSLTGVSEALRYFPGVEPARKALLEQAAADYARFAQDKSEDPTLRLEAGRSFLRLGDVRRLLTQYPESEEAYRSAEKQFRTLLADDAKNIDHRLELALTRMRLGVLATVVGPHEVAQKHFQAALDDLDALEGKDADGDRVRYEKAGVLMNYALLLNKLNRFDAAREQLEKAESTLEALDRVGAKAEVTARLAKARADLGQQLMMMDKAEQAVTKLNAAIDSFLVLTLEARNHPPYLEGLAAARISLANAQRILGRDAEVVAGYEAAIKDYDDLQKARPGVPYYMESLAVARTDLAQVLHLFGSNHRAKKVAGEALKVLIDLVNDHPDMLRYQEEHAICTQTFGLILRDLDDQELATVAFRDSIGRFRDLAEHAKDIPIFRRRLANNLCSMGRLLDKAGEHSQAEQMYRDAVAEFDKAMKAGLTDAYTKDPLAWCHTHLGDLLRKKKDSDKAKVCYASVLALREPMQTHPEHIHSLAWFLATCEDPAFRNPERAVALARLARKRVPDNPRYAHGLGLALFRAGKWDESIEALKQAEKLRIQPSAFDAFVLAMAYLRKEDPMQAQACHQRAVDLMQKECPGNIELIRIRAEAAALLK